MKLIRKEGKLVLRDDGGRLWIWILLPTVLIGPMLVPDRSVWPWQLGAMLLALSAVIALRFRESQTMIDPVGEAVEVRSRTLRSSQSRIYFFNEIEGPFEVVEESPITGKYIRVTLKSGVTLDLTQPNRRIEEREIVVTAEALNVEVFGKRLLSGVKMIGPRIP